ncbi:hypothetical protein ACFXTH_006865 [Malus domestica]
MSDESGREQEGKEEERKGGDRSGPGDPRTQPARPGGKSGQIWPFFRRFGPSFHLVSPWHHPSFPFHSSLMVFGLDFVTKVHVEPEGTHDGIRQF